MLPISAGSKRGSSPAIRAFALPAAKSPLRIAQRRMARRKKGSHRRYQARLLLARKHERIRNLRYDHAHKLTRRLVADFGFIAVEDLNVRGLVSGSLAKD